MRLDDLKLFTTVVELGSFSAAANALDLPRANVSRRIGELEKHLNAQLFFRTTRKLRLTQHGEVLYHELLQVVQGIEKAQEAMYQLDSKPAGKVKIGALPDSDELLQPILNQFQLQYPDIELDVRFSTNGYRDLYEQGLDLSFHVGPLQDSSLVARHITSINRFLLASPDYIAQYGAPESINDLAQHRCICYRWSDGRIEDTWRFTDSTLKVKPILSSNSTGYIRRSMIAGQGISFLPLLLAINAMESGELIRILPDCQSQSEDVWLIYPDRMGVSQATRALINHLLEHLPKIFDCRKTQD
ncbi:LysR family transcriptional regulator [Photobacterium gaetbulicola]|uniref:Transcriptional regulator n=2 Tax=Photobacterium gaetbulicola TaxID=1295392 RepID=A0A0B9GJ92_9GAMM|nr:LysR family transcriptional regulator [Photobacterium gaetbulicola]AJR05434.1 putative transcriptional regulator protein [Photobacterium gaetbulicola Gung47]KHT64855.1 transcriptional regulator [Photobacterium gaetbulicola]PSU12755.1 LysR family transcriptional regulator [Photobacterium gaetbulicola]